jgi:hypothetical protein
MRAHGIVAKRPTWPEAAGTARAFAPSIALSIRPLQFSKWPYKGFRALDTVPHVLTAITIDPKSVFVVDPSAIPNPNWLRPGIPSGGQQTFGDDLDSRHKIVLIPSVVFMASWNLKFAASNDVGVYQMKSQEAFALDARLHPPTSPRRVDP